MALFRPAMRKRSSLGVSENDFHLDRRKEGGETPLLLLPTGLTSERPRDNVSLETHGAPAKQRGGQEGPRLSRSLALLCADPLPAQFLSGLKNYLGAARVALLPWEGAVCPQGK